MSMANQMIDFSQTIMDEITVFGGLFDWGLFVLF